MKYYNLSNHGALTGCLFLIFFIMMVILAASKIIELEDLTEKYKDFQEYPPLNSQDIPIAVLVVSSIMIVTTGLMIVGIIMDNPFFMVPWILIDIFIIIGQVVYYLHGMLTHFNINMCLYFSILTGIQILILSPIIILFDDIRCKNIEKRTQDDLKDQQ